MTSLQDGEGVGALRVLVVDADLSVLDAYRRVLAPADGSGGPSRARLSGAAEEARVADGVPFDLTCVHRGPEGLEVVRVARAGGHPFALAFLDIDLFPGPDRLWLARAMRGLDPALHIVVVTGSSHLDREDLCRQVPPGDRLFCLRKPLHPHELGQIARTLGARWQAERAPARRAAPAREAEARSPSPERPEPRLDLQALEHLRALQRPGAPDIVARVVELYRESAERLTLAMRDAAERADAPALRMAAHGLKSASANVGALRLSALCRELEELARDGRLDGAGFRAEAIAAELQLVTRALAQAGVMGKPDGEAAA